MRTHPAREHSPLQGTSSVICSPPLPASRCPLRRCSRLTHFPGFLTHRPASAMFPFDPNRGVSDPSRWNALWTVTSRPSRPVGAVSRWKHWGSRPCPMPLPTSFPLTRLPHRTPDFPLVSQKRSRMAPVTRHSAAPSRSTHSIPGHGRRRANKCRALHRCSPLHGITSGAPAQHALPVERAHEVGRDGIGEAARAHAARPPPQWP